MIYDTHVYAGKTLVKPNLEAVRMGLPEVIGKGEKRDDISPNTSERIGFLQIPLIRI
jgi:hypothetical protein